MVGTHRTVSLFNFQSSILTFISLKLLHFISRFPFDTKNATGYSIATILQYLMAFYLVFSTAIMINLGIGAYLLGMSLANDLKCDLHSFIDSKISTEGNQMHALQQLAHFCHFHSIAKRLNRPKSALNYYKVKY